MQLESVRPEQVKTERVWFRLRLRCVPQAVNASLFFCRARARTERRGRTRDADQTRSTHHRVPHGGLQREALRCDSRPAARHPPRATSRAQKSGGRAGSNEVWERGGTVKIFPTVSAFLFSLPGFVVGQSSRRFVLVTAETRVAPSPWKLRLEAASGAISTSMKGDKTPACLCQHHAVLLNMIDADKIKVTK